MNTFSIIQTGDHHLDPKNLAYTVPALDAVIEMVEDRRPDLFLFTGDAWIHRGRVDANAGWVWRTRMERGADAANFGAALTMGNHDQVFKQGKVDNITAIMTGADAAKSDGHNVTVFSTIQTMFYGKYTTQRKVAVVHVPTPNKYWAEKAIREVITNEETETAPTIQGLLTQAIQGQIVTAREVVGENGAVLVSYHGTVSGSRLGNEMVMTAGIDIAVSRDAFRGADLVMAGHIHNPQVMAATDGAPAIWYNGALTPLTFNDVAMEPVVYHHTINFSDGGRIWIETETLPVPVTSNMWDIPVSVDDFDDAEEYGIRMVLESRMNTVEDGAAGPAAGDRVRFKITAPAGIVRQISDDMLESLRVDCGLESVTKVVERVVDHVAAMDTERTMSVLDALDTWLTINHGAMADDDLRFIRALAREIETTVEDENIDAHYSFMPVLLKVKNWAQYANAEIDFNKLDPLVAVRGSNTAGKSNLMRAIPFALFKKMLFGDVIGDLVTNGERDGEVELYFKSGSGVGVAGPGAGYYRIRRTIRKAANGRGATAKLFFERSICDEGEEIINGEWTLAVEGTAGETEKAIQDLVGPPDLFLSTSFATQNTVDAVLNLGPADFRDMLQSVLHRNFTARAEASAIRRRSVEKNTIKLTNECGVYAKQAADLKDAKYDLQESDAALEQAATLSMVVDEDLTAEREKLITAGAKHAGMAAVLKSHDAEISNHNALKLDAGKAAERVTVAASARVQLEAIRKNIDVCGAVDVESARNTAKRAAAIYNDSQRELTEYRTEAGTRRDYLAGAVRDASTEAAVAGGASTTLMNEVARLNRTVGIMNEVPCGGTKWNPDGQYDGMADTVDMAGCQFLKDAAIARDRLPVATNELKGATTRKFETEATSTAAREEFDKYETNFKAEESRLIGVCNSRHSEMQDTNQTLETVEAAERKVAGLRAEEAALMAVAGAHAERVTESEALAGKLAKSQAIIDGFDDAKMDVSMALDTMESRRVKVSDLEENSKTLKLRLDGLNAAAVRHLAAVEAAKDAAEKEDEYKVKIAGGESMVTLFTIFETAVGRDGIPQLMLENMVLPAMQSMTNDYLAETEFRVTVEPDRETVSGEAKAGVFVSFTDEMGEHPLSAASGFQRVALGQAIRNALSGLHALATGTKLWFAFQDEGFGAYDEANLAGAKVTLRRIAKDRRWFIYISHVDGMADVADSVIDVTRVDGRSTVSIS